VPLAFPSINRGTVAFGFFNIEADMLVKAARHSVEQILGKGEMLTADKLRDWGYGK